MLLTNFCRAIGIKYGANVQVKAVDGANFNIGPNSLTYSGSNYLYVKIGSGNSTPSFSDYALESPIDITRYSYTWQGGAELSDGTLYWATTVYTNNSGSNVTVKEVGLYAYARNPSGGAFKDICLARKVLDTPIVIEPNESYNFTYKISVQT